jgi:hypothetical protein
VWGGKTTTPPPPPRRAHHAVHRHRHRPHEDVAHLFALERGEESHGLVEAHVLRSYAPARTSANRRWGRKLPDQRMPVGDQAR